MGRPLNGRRPKSLTIFWLNNTHYSAFAYDLRKLGLTPGDVFAGRVLWRDSWAYVQEILRDPDSHVVHAINGSTYVPSPQERIGLMLFEAELNAKRRKNTVPITIPRAWEGKGAASPPERFVREDHPERLAAIRRLKQLTPDSPQEPQS